MAAENEAARIDEPTAARGAEAVPGGQKNRDSGRQMTSQLRSDGIDTDRMTEAAGERVSELQRLLIEEVRAQPLRALAWAAAAGVIVGLWAAR